MTPDDKADPNAEEEGYAELAKSLFEAVEQPDTGTKGYASADTPVEPETSTENQPT